MLNIDAPQAFIDKRCSDFAESWLTAWNRHDVNSVLSHYADDVVLVSPIINKIMGNESGILLTKDDLGNYCKKIFKTIPELKFKLMEVAVGVECVTIHYSNPEFHVLAEVVKLNSDWKISKSTTYY